MTNRNPIILLGGGGHAAVVADAASRAGLTILGYLADAPAAASLPGDPAHLGTPEVLPAIITAHHQAHPPARVHPAAGDTDLRRTWIALAEDQRVPLATIIHPAAIVADSATIGEGTFIGPGAIVNPRATIGDGCIINSGAIVEHDCVVESFAHLAPGAVLTGNVHIGAAALIGAASVVLPGLTIGDAATVGAGAVVTRHVDAGVTVTGAPARAQLAPTSREP